jgi:predicted porin
MKPSTIGLAATLSGLSACNVVTAQGITTVYGIIDTFLINIHAEDVPAATRVDTGGLYASRLGVRGSENLGSILQANYALEIGFNSDDGSQADMNRLFSRQSWVGLSQRWGELRFGRQNTPQFTMNSKFDAFGATRQVSGWNNMFGAALRVDNAVGFFSSDVGGFKLHALFARGALAGGAPLPEVSGNRNVHLALEYEKGPLYAGINHEKISNTALAYQVKRSALGMSYQVNQQWQLFAAVNRELASNGSIDSNLYSISLRYNFSTASSLGAGYVALRDHAAGAGHGGAAQSSIQYRYGFSKRTTLYAGYSHLRQRGQRNSFGLGGAAVVQPAAPIAAMPGGEISGLHVGIVHFF